jgi:hypothetical protein
MDGFNVSESPAFQQREFRMFILLKNYSKGCQEHQSLRVILIEKEELVYGSENRADNIAIDANHAFTTGMSAVLHPVVAVSPTGRDSGPRPNL